MKKKQKPEPSPAILLLEECNSEPSVYVPGAPFAKQRPRATRRGRFMTVYTPKQTKKYENRVRDAYLSQNGYRILKGPLEVEIKGTFPVPISATKRKKQAMLRGEILHTKKPDCDNLAKTPLDGLNGIAYNDDSQIVKLTISKEYGEEPGLFVTLKEIKE